MAKFKSWLLIFAIFNFYPFCAWCFPFTMEKTIKIDRFLGQCPGVRNMPLYFENIHLASVRRIYYISTKIIATRDLKPDLRLVLELERCKSKEALDSCEPYPDINIRNICDMMKGQYEPWTPFIKTVHPDFRCPVEKGVYIGTNGTFDGGPLLVLPVEGWYWKVRAKSFEMTDKGKNMIMCLYVEGQIVNI